MITSLVPVHETPPLSQADYEAVKAALRSAPALLFVRVLRCTGLRESEVLSLTPERVRRVGPHVLLEVQRRKKRRPVWEQVPLHPEVGLELEAFVRFTKPGSGHSIWPWGARRIQQIFKAASISALGSPRHPHQIRHLYVTWLMDRNVSAAVAGALVGHADGGRTAQEWYYDLTPEKRFAVNSQLPV